LAIDSEVDPLAEKYYSISPYAYCAGNPVKRIDPDGMAIYTTHDFDEIKDALNELKARWGDDEGDDEGDQDSDKKEDQNKK
jgi:hypothetical protein